MEPTLKILILEDSISDADFIQRLLAKEPYQCTFSVAMNKKDYVQALEKFAPDVILSDNSLPQFNSTEALKLGRQILPHIPFILVTGTVSEEFAANIIKLGADDYILKDRMARLPAAIDAALKQRTAEKGREDANTNLKLLENKILEQKIQEHKRIARAIIKAQDAERNHIGKELHDNINQILAASKMHLSVAGHENESIRELVKYPLQLLETSIQEIRILSQKLVTPLKNINLEKLIRELLTVLTHDKATRTNFTYALSKEAISDDLKLNIYRVMQEQINNILKYAAAKTVTISITDRDGSVNIVIADDGNGFDPDSKTTGIGISNMIDRVESFNGKLQIQSSAGNGCTTRISIPC